MAMHNQLTERIHAHRAVRDELEKHPECAADLRVTEAALFAYENARGMLDTVICCMVRHPELFE